MYLWLYYQVKSAQFYSWALYKVKNYSLIYISIFFLILKF